MERLISKQQEEAKRKRNQIIVGIVLVAVMVLSTLGFALQGNNNSGNKQTNKLTYNGFKFVYKDGLWTVGNFVFKNNPNEVPEIGTGLKDATYYQKLPLYIYSENEDAEIEIYLNLQQIAERVQPACLEGLKCSGDSPIKTCTDNFIIIKESNNSRISQENSCVYIEGTNEEIIKLADQFLFKILKIKE